MSEKITALIENNHKNFPKDTAGNVMTLNVPVVSPETTVEGVISLLDKNSSNYAAINYIYVVEEKNLRGIISIKEIFRKDHNITAKSIMHKDIISARPFSHIENVAYLALEHNIKSIPIVNKEGIFLGVITGDVILSTTYKEVTEDMFKFAGMSHTLKFGDDIMKMSLKESLRHRLPWILLGLFGGVSIAQIIGFFEHTLEKTLILAAFIPLIVYMSNAVGQQVTAFMIRDFAIKGKIDFLKYFKKHLQVVSTIALIMGIFLFTYSFFVHKNIVISKILGLAMFSTVLSSILTGFFIPYMFSKLNSDPANASGPVGTVIQDAMSVLIYFLIASYFL